MTLKSEYDDVTYEKWLPRHDTNFKWLNLKSIICYSNERTVHATGESIAY